MTMRILFACVLVLTMYWAAPSAAAIQLSDCLIDTDPDSVDARVCQLQVLATYQAMRYTQTRHGLAQQTCDLGADIEPEELTRRLTTDLREVQTRIPDLPGIAVVITALSTTRECPHAMARDFGGPDTSWLIRTCRRALEQEHEDDVALCGGYLGTAFEALNLTSGWKGADEFLCVPKRGLKIKALLEMLIDQAIRDQDVQSAPAIEVLAESVSRKYPCP